MQEVADSRQQTEQEKHNLRLEEESILNDVINSNGTLTTKIKRWAEVLERRIELLDCSFSISYISTYISHKLGELPIAHNVNRCLADKYKDPSQQRFNSIDKKLEQLKNGTHTECERIEDCSVNSLPLLLETERNTKNKADELITEAKKLVSDSNNRITLIRQRAMELGLEQLLDEKYRGPISCYDFRMKVPDDQDLHWYNNETSKNLIATGEWLITFGEKDFLDFPPHDVDKAKKYTETSRIWRLLFSTITEKKWSGSRGFWLDRNYWKKVQSSHDSGNSTKFNSTLCAWCSKDIDEDPRERHIMHYDKSSPTTYRCDRCHGTAVLDKGNSREQVGDKSEENDMIAREILAHAPLYGDLFEDWRVRWLEPTVYARKRAIQEPFSKSSIAGADSIVVPRKKANK